MRSPDAAQYEVVRRRSGVLLNSEFAKVPGLQRTASRCAAPGTSVLYRQQRHARDKRPYAMLRTSAKPANRPAMASTTDSAT
jgi:hypothetical protein